MVNSNLVLEDVAQEASEGDSRALERLFAILVPELQDLIRRLCSQWGVPPDLVDDFAHQSIINVVEHCRRNDRPRHLLPFVRRIARNLVVDWLRRQKRHIQISNGRLNQLVSNSVGGQSMFEISDGFKQLSKMDQVILELTLIKGYSPSEAASELQIGIWTAYKRHERAIKRLRALLQSTH